MSAAVHARAGRARLQALVLLTLAVSVLASCSRAPSGDGPPLTRASGPLPPDAVPKMEPRSRYGNPSSYEVFGRRYHVMASSSGYAERGVASWYGSKFHGRRTSSGEIYDMHQMSAAHKSLPLPTYVEVRNLENGARAIVRVNDRGPFHDNRIIDLSYAAARKLGVIAKGTGLVEVRAIDAGAAVPRTTRVAAPSAATMVPTLGAAVSAAGPSPASVPLPPPAAPRLFLQAGAFAQQVNADGLRERLHSMLDATVTVQRLPSQTLPMHRVRIGPLPDIVTADRLTRQMLDAGLPLPQIVVE